VQRGFRPEPWSAPVARKPEAVPPCRGRRAV
jgi:hypothetical protein